MSASIQTIGKGLKNVVECNSIHFFNLPIPPSSNSQYVTVKRGSKNIRVSSRELALYKHLMNQYPYNCEAWLYHKHTLSKWLKEDHQLEIRCIFKFHYNRMFTKDGRIKKMDVSNRIKALHDSLCDLLGFDDSRFFRVSAEKQICHENLGEMVCVEILPITENI